MYLCDAISLLKLSTGSNIDVFYNDDMGIFPSTIFEGYNNLDEQEIIIKKSIKLPKIDDYFLMKFYGLNLNDLDDEKLEKICHDILVDFCKKNNINYN